ncbi:MAG: outer membrane beta-barrel protein [Gemmatimonadales bacterium]|nr:outer membrane beta-barrel protein [Gemmatimonadales bacterium]
MRAKSTGRLAVILASLLPLAAQAQSQAIGQQDLVSSTPGLAEVNPDVLTFRAGVGLEHHSNIFNLPDGVEPTEATYGGSGRSDMQLRGLFGVNFDKQVSLQRFQLFGTLEPVKFMEFSRFDHVAYDLGANWDWAIGRPWFGTLGLRLSERLSGFDTITISDKNREQRNRYYATAGMRLTPDWAIVSGIDLETTSNSASALEYYDYDFLSYELGARYTRGRQAEFEFVWRHTDGDYPNRQLLDSSGNVLPASVDNEFSQDAALVRLQYRPSNDSRIAGHVGYTRRSYDTQSGRDFSGLVAGLDLDWSPTGAFQMRTSLIHEIQPEDLLTANHVTATSIVLRPMYQITGRIGLEGLAQYTTRDYDGDPLAGGTREDDVSIIGLDAIYAYSRTITGRAGIQYVKRDSNINQFDFDDTRITLSVIANF